jgi:hypothetical protein
MTDSDDEETINIKGAVNPYEIMTDSKRKRQSKAEKLSKIIAGREKFESRERELVDLLIQKKNVERISSCPNLVGVRARRDEERGKFLKREGLEA